MFDRRGFLVASAAVATTGPAWARAADRADAIASESGFNGVMLLGKDGRATFRKAYGLADAETGRAASAGDRYIIASVSKWLSVAAILQLVERERMSLDMTIGETLPFYADKAGARVTLRQLLNNTSGVPNFYGPAAEADPGVKISRMSTREAVDAFCSGELAFEPGARFDYAITNWILVAAMVEAVAGKPFRRVVDDLVVTPLRLRDTAVAGPDFFDSQDTAKAYATLSPVTPKMSPRPEFLAAAGGYCSTADDLLRAACGVFDENLLSPASMTAMLTITVPEQHYALGGRVATLSTPDGVRRAAWETGRTDGYRSVLAHVLDERRTVVLLNNTDMSQQTMDQIALRLLDAAWA